MPITLVRHDHDARHRCSWCNQGEAFTDYVAYHDDEWGVPVADDRRLFEKITLEGFQSGLSWLTVLRKRDRFREVFESFEIERVARFTEADVDRLVGDAGIIRHRGKIVSAVNNARRVLALRDAEGASLARFVWRFEPHRSTRPAAVTTEIAATLTQSDASVRLSKALKGHGFTFVGPTTMYAFMQSMGVVNDHLHGCHAQAAVEAARAAFVRP